MRIQFFLIILAASILAAGCWSGSNNGQNSNSGDSSRSETQNASPNVNVYAIPNRPTDPNSSTVNASTNINGTSNDWPATSGSPGWSTNWNSNNLPTTAASPPVSRLPTGTLNANRPGATPRPPRIEPNRDANIRRRSEINRPPAPALRPSP
jgi:hypothetical protein